TVWDVQAKNLQKVIVIKQPIMFLSAGFSGDNRMLATGAADGTVRILEIATGRQLRVIEGRHVRVYSVEFSPDGTHLASVGREGRIRLSNTTDWRQSGSFESRFGSEPCFVSFSADGLTLAASGADDHVVLYDLRAVLEMKRKRDEQERKKRTQGKGDKRGERRKGPFPESAPQIGCSPYS